MSLRPPSRLPKSLNRPTGPMAQSIAKRYSRAPARGFKRRREQFGRNTRRWNKSLKVFWVEFRMWLAILLAAVILVGICTLLFSPIFNVKQIQIRRQDPRIDIEEIQQALSPLFQGRLLFVSKAQVTEMLSEQFPDIRSVDIEKTYPSTLAVSLYLDPVIAELDLEGEDQPVVTGTGATETGSMTYAYVTSRGHAVFSSIKLSKEKLPRIILVDWGVRPANRSLVIAPAVLRTLFDARNTLQTDFGYQVTGMTMYLRAQEFHIRLEKVSLWFDLSSPLDVQFRRFREFLRSLSLDQVKEYIDLRISDRVIYK